MAKDNHMAEKREKSYNLEFRYEPDYSYVRATGIRSIENMFPITQECVEACLKRGYKKVLLDARELIGRLSVSEIYGTGRDLADRFKSYPRLELAVIDLDENRKNFKFFEDVLVNLGYNVGFFSDVADAKQWLGVKEET